MNLGEAKDSVGRHGNKVYNTLSAGAIIWMLATFASKESFTEHCRRCEKANDENAAKRSQIWQKIGDMELDVQRIDLTTVKSGHAGE